MIAKPVTFHPDAVNEAEAATPGIVSAVSALRLKTCRIEALNGAAPVREFRTADRMVNHANYEARCRKTENGAYLPNVVIRPILLIWRRLPLCLRLHLLFPCQRRAAVEKTQRKPLRLVF